MQPVWVRDFDRWCGDPHVHVGHDECEGVRLVAEPGLREAHPGEPHDFRTTCQRCGEAGFLHVSLITDLEVVKIEDRAALQASEAEPEPRG
jgi:hypothetical protein